MDRLDAMEVFAAVATHGSFTAAARALRRPRSTVTAAVQGLEARLGVRLLHRTTRQVSLTPDGGAYLREVRRILGDVEALEAGLGARASEVRGRVRVDVPASAGRHVIAPALPGFFARHPHVVLELGSADRPVDLIAEGVDCVLRGGDVHDGSLVGRRLVTWPVVTCASPGYLARHGVPTVDTLDRHRFVVFFSPRTGRVFDPELALDGTLRPIPASHALAVNDADTWIASAIAGIGLAQLPCSSVVRALLHRGDLVQVLPDVDAGSLPLHVLWPRARRLPGRVRAFVDWVVELYDGAP